MIRNLTTQDAAEAAALHALCFPKGWPAQDFARYVLDPAVTARAVVKDGRILAVCVATLVSAEAEILTVMVHPDHRRQGLGQSLLQDMLEQGGETWILDVAADNLPAILLYRRLGFLEIRRRKGYYANGVDALVMAGPMSSLQ
jgi:ribosomal-protein-alanine N-acetyltransferase